MFSRFFTLSKIRKRGPRTRLGGRVLTERARLVSLPAERKKEKRIVLTRMMQEQTLLTICKCHPSLQRTDVVKMTHS